MSRIVSALLVCALIAGCGGGSDPETPTDPVAQVPDTPGLREAVREAQTPDPDSFPSAGGKTLQQVADLVTAGPQAALASSVFTAGENRFVFGVIGQDGKAIYGPSAIYIARRWPKADYVAFAAAELTVVLGVIVLLTGPLWAIKSWGVWWDWEPRLTSTLIMWLVFSSYLLLRRFGGPGSELLAAAVGIFGATLAPFVYWSVNMWRTLHPKTSVLPSLPGPMAGPVIWCAVAFVLLYTAVILLRVRLESTRATLERAFLLLEED